VLSDPEKSPSLPFEAFCSDSIHPSVVKTVLPNRGSYGEISRLAVPAEFRRRKDDQGAPIPMQFGMQAERDLSERRHSSSYMTMGLFLAAAAMGLIRGMTGAFAMMELRLARYLRQFGLEFEQVGDEVEYHGRRAAFYITKEGLKLNNEVAELLDHIVSEIKAQVSKPAGRS
jgi:N-acyl amino acid synthase of PEP-CTERM/exosortase system